MSPRRSPLWSRRAVLALGIAAPALALPRGLRADDDPRAAVVAMVEAGCAALAAYGFPRGIGKAPPDTWSRLGLSLYVFLLDSGGRLLLHPDGSMEGRDVTGARDAGGAPFIQHIMQAAAAARPAGVWTDYLWPAGAPGQVGTKHTYSKMVATPDAGDLIVSAGYVATEI